MPKKAALFLLICFNGYMYLLYLPLQLVKLF